MMLRVLSVLALLCVANAVVDYTVNPCDAERGEPGAYAWCWECTNVATEAECNATGEYIRCPSHNEICFKFTQVHGTNDGSSSDTVKFDRGCKTITSCENAALGPDDWACSPDREDPAMTNCLNCYYGDYYCQPPNPCPDDENGDPVNVWCLRCRNEATDAQCAAFGEYEECRNNKVMCFRNHITQHNNGKVLITKGCATAQRCNNAALGPLDQACNEETKNGQAATVCLTCDYNVTTQAACEPKPPIACIVWGDPHIIAFGSSMNYRFRGYCWHTFVTDIGCPGVGDNRFEILGNFLMHKPSSDKQVLYQIRMRLKLDTGEWIQFDLDQGPTASYTDENGMRYNLTDADYPFVRHDITLSKTYHPHTEFGNDFVNAAEAITLKFAPDDMYVRWDGIRKVKIILPPAMHGHVCGMCGPIEDFTGDMLIGPHDNSVATTDFCSVLSAGLPQHTKTPHTQEWVDSWITEQGDENADCVTECA